ncbi:hypothetical protein GQ44DRAFT_682411 [Phaeosphaeriaceae sp. PMI808]|nr:hypothetical protein GQ44DRAFT_682411 [Phaeosphaeriaceae sp. PMI808]
MLTPTELLIQKLYHSYRHTADIDQKGLFFSPNCMQICRPIPTYTAATRGEIVQYLKDAQQGNVPVESSAGRPKNAMGALGVYTIRPLHPTEVEFGSSSATSALNCTPAQLLQKVNDESWVGMRVDLWDKGPSSKGLLVKVQYWWRKETIESGEEMDGDAEGLGWRQCLHDIMYLGPKDGSEGSEGLPLLE